MCVIVRKPMGTCFGREIFSECWKRNSHGLGFFTKNGREQISEKGLMNEDDAYNKVQPFLSEQWDTVIHFRIQSRGGVKADLTHPFECGNSRLLFHNGTIKIFPHPSLDSDTKSLANMIARLSDDDAKSLLTYLASTSQGRFVFVDSRGDIHIYGDNESVEKNGLWFSNLKHETYKGATGGVYYGDDSYGGHDCYPHDYYDRYDFMAERRKNIANISEMSGVPVSELEDLTHLAQFIGSLIKTPELLHRFLLCE